MCKDKLIHNRKRHKHIFKISQKDKTNNDLFLKIIIIIKFKII
jgi:hypothetical protein